jgi:hypothetical protein
VALAMNLAPHAFTAVTEYECLRTLECVIMTTLTIRNVEPELKERLRAARSQRPLD